MKNEGIEGAVQNPTQAWIAGITSQDPAERITARINLLRTFPTNGSADYKLAHRLHSDLTKDVRANPNLTLEIITASQDLQEQAYRVMATDYGFYPKHNARGDEKTTQEAVRESYINAIEPLAQKLSDVESETTRFNVAETIVHEGNLEPALIALETILSFGHDGLIYQPAYSHSGLGYGSIIDSWRWIINAGFGTKHLEVRKKAL
jgi:hypothetical protein